MHGATITSMAYHTGTVASYNASRLFDFPIRATFAHIYLYSNDLAFHVIFIKDGDTYNKRNIGFNGDHTTGWDFCQSNWGSVGCWYHWRHAGDRITAFAHWWN